MSVRLKYICDRCFKEAEGDQAEGWLCVELVAPRFVPDQAKGWFTTFAFCPACTPRFWSALHDHVGVPR